MAKKQVMSRHINVVLDKELYTLVTNAAASEGISVSAVTRTALRAFFGVASGQDAGFREGYTAGYHSILEAVKRAVATIDSAKAGAAVVKKRVA